MEIDSNTGSIVAVAEPASTLCRRVNSVPHGFGGLPDNESNRGYYQDGISPNLLLNDKVRETINAMPRMTGFKVPCAGLAESGRVVRESRWMLSVSDLTGVRAVHHGSCCAALR
uniref:hypothetical protein n=1 Tax=Edaphosphingomonas laterariae TaxID=861865 RepID=UPI001181A7F8|nr:hypothetical protein [Sphingomonas laterariae]